MTVLTERRGEGVENVVDETHGSVRFWIRANRSSAARL